MTVAFAHTRGGFLITDSGTSEVSLPLALTHHRIWIILFTYFSRVARFLTSDGVLASMMSAFDKAARAILN